MRVKFKPEVSIVIVHYLNYKALVRCLSSIYKTTELNFEIIVVDNDEKNPVKDKLLKLFPQVKYVTANKNIGFGSGVNLGVTLSLAPYLFILNPDTQLKNNSISSMIRILRKNTKVGILCPNYTDLDGKSYLQQGSRSLTPLMGVFSLTIINRVFPNNYFSKKYWLKDINIQKEREVDVVPGSAFMIRKSIFKKVGGFDESFFLYFEESDLCKRVKELGYKIIITPEAQIIHEWKGSTPNNPSIKRIFMKSRFYYFKKHYGLTWAIIVEAFARFSKWHALAILITIFVLFTLI